MWETFQETSMESLQALGAQLLAIMLEEIDYGMVLVDGRLRVMHANVAGRRRLEAEGHALFLHEAHLCAHSAQDMRAVADAVLSATLRLRRCLLPLHCHGRREVYAVVPLPLAGRDTLALMLASRDDVCQPLSWQAFARLHGLTQAEASVLARLCKGERPAEVARRSGVAVSTVRTQIASLRAKAGVQTVGELIRELATLPPLLGALRY